MANAPKYTLENLPADAVARLLAVMQQLRNPDGGCPWDLEQNFATIAPYTIEEAYEVADAIERQDMAALKDELGDLLLQVVFHAQMAREAGSFDFEAVATGIADKMVRRHPHVFGDAKVADADAQTVAWEDHKETERRAKASAEGRSASVLDGVAAGLPALMRAVKLQRRAARVGFDWPHAADVFLKIDEELSEIKEEMQSGSAERVSDEIGDLLFAVVNLARHLEADPEAALRHANAKFERRFRQLEAELVRGGGSPAAASLDELEALWQRVKADEGDR
ncbi:MAG TPA: nucleoside triphosphate pyrophosphohydrolase [Candidatus Acidoferrum sp.]|nr:nucleoside triphosphate pyrophosphohydrolase [Candidatus Acidoferrum sp.]